LENVPDGQDKHEFGLEAPIASKYLPLGQETHAIAPGFSA
jgi:hypothetical protein